MSAKPWRELKRTARWLAVDKDSGVTVIPARNEDQALALRQRIEADLRLPLWVVHRIDRDTSGVVLFALDADAHRQLSGAFEHARVRKSYLAFTAGQPPADSGWVDLAVHSARKGKMRPAYSGEVGAKAARTEYHVEARRAVGEVAVARVRCHPQSGRQHQIRVHLRSLGCPILRDALYGSVSLRAPWDALPIQRLALHAARLELPPLLDLPAHVIDAELPADLRALDDWLMAPRDGHESAA